MSKKFIVASFVVLALAAFAGGAWLYQSRIAPPATETAAVVEPIDQSTLIRPHSPVIGEADAPVTIVEFFDPACEACGAFYPHVKDILARGEGNVRLVLRYAAFHGPMSIAAVGWLEAARKQDKFEELLNIVMTRQPDWAGHGAPAPEKFADYAREVGMDVERGRKDSVDPSVAALLDAEMADIKANEIGGTPTFFINGQPLVSFSPEGLDATVSAALQSNPAQINP